MSKIVSKDDFKNNIRPAIKKDGKTIGLCHGVFDLVHPGHLTHLKQAKDLCDVLVVSITAARYVRKGPGRPYFNDDQRLEFLAALECVDYVILSEGYTVDDIVENVEPDYYIKGEEYKREDEDITGKIREERLLVESHGGKIAFTGGEVFSSTNLLNTAMNALPKDVVDYMIDMKERHSMEEVREYADRIKDLRILVIGDIIIDRYTYCRIQGLISKDMAYSARLQSSEDYYGGSAAIARHLSSFSDHVTLMSIVGNEDTLVNGMQSDLEKSMELKLYRNNTVPTIIKERFLTKNDKREEYNKIFAINNIIDNINYDEAVLLDFFDELEKTIENYDAVFLCDFGHGLVGARISEIVQAKANFLVLNCQTNSSNRGRNIITKYHRADAFSLDQIELGLAYPAIVSDEKDSLVKLSQNLGGDGWLTRGSKGAYGVSKKAISKDDVMECPALTLSVKDTIGAGDAFYACAGAFKAAGADSELCLFVGNIAGALGANIVGNKESLEVVNVLKYASTLFNV